MTPLMVGMALNGIAFGVAFIYIITSHKEDKA
jgi:hypothetical protein